MPTHTALILVCLGALACRTAPAAPEPTGARAGRSSLGEHSSIPASDRALDEGNAIAAIRRGDYGEARSILSAMLARERLSAGRALLSEGLARDALVALDEVLQLDPDNAAGWFERGRAAFLTAPTDSQPTFFYTDALENFEQASRHGYGVAAKFWASRAARMTLDPDKALRLAREGMAELNELDQRPQLGMSAERTLTEASFDVYVEKKNISEDATAYFDEIQTQLDTLIGRQPEDPWVWLQLANLYQWEGYAQEALDALERGLDVSPESRLLHQRYSETVRAERGPAGVLDAYDRFNAKHAGSVLGLWYAALETFEIGMEDLSAKVERSATFEASEKLFRACRELAPEYAVACRGYEVMTRNAVGWSRLYSQDLQGAKEAFLSTEDLMENGLQWKIEGRLLSGVEGLDYVAFNYAQDTTNAESLENAAAIYDLLHAYDSQNSDFANNAGFFNRDAAVAIEFSSQQTSYRASQSEDPEERKQLEAEATRKKERARELMRRSYAAYEEATRLAPNDVRVINDTGLIMTYYLRDDVEAAERYLMRAVELGAEQLPVTTLEGQELIDLQEAWGDAHQNLGILYLTLNNDPAKAKDWFQKSIEIGPRPDVPRSNIIEMMIPACDKALSGEPNALAEVERMIWK